MSYDPKKVLAIAEGEVGYLEKASNSSLDSKTANAGSANYTKYARDMDAIAGFYNGRKQGFAWCDVFVDWCFVQAYGVEEGRALLCQPLKSTGAGCRYSRAFYKAKGQLHDSGPQPGDQIFFWPSDRSDPNAVAHTGIVYAVDKSYVYTIEGNTSSASGVISNGGGVAKKKYSLSYNRLAGYGRPAYGTQATTPAPTPSPSPKEYELGERTLRKNDKGSDVAALQAALVALGFDCGKYGPKKDGVDGDYGEATKAAVSAFQRAAGITVDGIFGPVSMKALTAMQAGVKPPQAAPKYTVTITGVDAATANYLMETYPNARATEETAASAG